MAKSKTRARVKDVQLRLKNADNAKNRYTIEVLADDEVVLFKDQRLREPVEFYVTGANRPYEIVVTRIEKDKVTGYLSKPKAVELAHSAK